MEDALVLKAIRGPMAGLTIPLGDGERVLFGRSPRCGKGALPADRAVGWHQFTIQVCWPEATLWSLGKTNPTFVNGVACGPGPSSEVTLREGDRIQAGHTLLEASFSTAPQLRRGKASPTAGEERRPRVLSAGAVAEADPMGAAETAGQAKVLRLIQPGPRPASSGLGHLSIALTDGPPQVGGFTIQRLLKRGSLGTSYAAQRDSDGLGVILKVARAAGLTPVQLQELQDCLAGLARWRHDNIVPLLDYGLACAPVPDRAEAAVVLCLERCRGESLADAVSATSGRLPPQKVYDLIRDGLNALQSAHAQGTYHRNLKPQNVLLVETGSRTRAVLTDFLLPHLPESLREAHPETLGWVGRDSAPFLPPAGWVETRGPAAADLWSLGAIALSVLTGLPPQQALSSGLAGEPHPQWAASSGHRLLAFARGVMAGEFRTAVEMALALGRLERPPVVRHRATPGKPTE